MKLKEKQEHFEDLYPKIFSEIYRFVSWRIPTSHDAEDIVSDVFLKAYERLKRWDDTRGTLPQWMMGITKNAIVDYWKKRPLTSELQEAWLVAADQKWFAELDDVLVFNHLMERLTPKQRAWFALRYIDDMTYEQIAAHNGKNSAAVRNWFSRLHRKIKIDLLKNPVL